MQSKRKYYQARNEVSSFTKYTALIETEKTVEKHTMASETLLSTPYQMDKTDVPRLRTTLPIFQDPESKKTFYFEEETKYFEGYFQFPTYSKSSDSSLSQDLTKQQVQL